LGLRHEHSVKRILVQGRQGLNVKGVDVVYGQRSNALGRKPSWHEFAWRIGQDQLPD
jgi:hypothetical protein